MKKGIKILWLIIILVLCAIIVFLLQENMYNKKEQSSSSIQQSSNERQSNNYFMGNKSKLIYAEGKTLIERIKTPEKYERIAVKDESFASFLRSFPLNPHNSNVLLYDGTEKGNQDVHVAIFDLKLNDKNLQQCADSIIRLYAEYYWDKGEFDKINFHLTSGFLMEYVKWRDGYRIEVAGNNVKWVKTKEYDDSYKSFESYLDNVFNYAGTLSVSKESTQIDDKDIEIGDIFIHGGSPGHVVLVVDMAINENGEKAFLLAQGFMPAQQFHILKNPLHEGDPWYYQSELTYPLDTPQYSFEKGSLKRLKYNK